jgi:hypothetical protein
VSITIDEDVWFGRPGQIQKLWAPKGGILATRDVSTTTFFTGAGGARVNKALNGTRTYTLQYGGLGRDSFTFLDAFQQGHQGVGPFIVIDPGRRNKLTANQSSSTSLTNDTTDFVVTGTSVTMTSDNTLITPLPNTLKMLFGASTPGTTSLVLGGAWSTWPGIPVRPDMDHCFWCMVVGGPIDVQAVITWLGLTGNVLGTSTSAALTTNAVNWQRLSVVGTPPIGTVWCTAQILPASATIASGESLWFSSFMLNTGNQPDPIWAPGSGVWPVQVIGLPEKYAFHEPGMLVDPTLTLQEVH